MKELNDLEQQFSQAVLNGETQEVEVVLTEFDQTCRRLIDQEIDLEKKEKLITSCLKLHNQWQLEIIKLKAKVKGELADIKSNGKKIQKYLTSY